MPRSPRGAERDFYQDDRPVKRRAEPKPDHCEVIWHLALQRDRAARRVGEAPAEGTADEPQRVDTRSTASISIAFPARLRPWTLIVFFVICGGTAPRADDSASATPRGPPRASALSVALAGSRRRSSLLVRAPTGR
jgi:hypothetical protein